MRNILIVSLLFLNACSVAPSQNGVGESSVSSASSKPPIIWETFENEDFTVLHPQGSHLFSEMGGLIITLPTAPLAPTSRAFWEIKKWDASDTSLQDLVDQIDTGGEQGFGERIEKKESIELNGTKALLVMVTQNGNRDQRVLVESKGSIFSIDHARDGGYYDSKYNFEKFYKSFTVK